MTMPAGWTATGVGPTDTQALLSLLGASSADLASLVRSILDLTQARPSMVGADLRDTSTRVPPNVTVLIQPSGGLPLDFVGSIVQQLVTRMPGVARSPGRQKVNLPSGDAIRLDYQVQTAAGSAISLRTFIVVRGSQTFLITFTSAADRASEQQSTFEGMINSLRFGG